MFCQADRGAGAKKREKLPGPSMGVGGSKMKGSLLVFGKEDETGRKDQGAG